MATVYGIHGGYSPIVSYLLVKMTLFDKVFAHRLKKQEHQTTPAVSFRLYTNVSPKTHLEKLFCSLLPWLNPNRPLLVHREGSGAW